MEDQFGDDAAALLLDLKGLRTPVARAGLQLVMETAGLDFAEFQRAVWDAERTMWVTWHWEQAPPDRLSDSSSMRLPFRLLFTCSSCGCWVSSLLPCRGAPLPCILSPAAAHDICLSLRHLVAGTNRRIRETWAGLQSLADLEVELGSWEWHAARQSPPWHLLQHARCWRDPRQRL